MNDTIRAVIEMLRQLGKSVEADEVQALLSTHMTTIREFEAAQQHAYAEGRKDEHAASAAPDLLEALRGVLRVADRATDEFDAAHAAIVKATGAITRRRIFESPEKSRSQRLREAGFTPRDRRLQCDSCGHLFSLVLLQAHKCEE